MAGDAGGTCNVVGSTAKLVRVRGENVRLLNEISNIPNLNYLCM